MSSFDRVADLIVSAAERAASKKKGGVVAPATAAKLRAELDAAGEAAFNAARGDDDMARIFHRWQLVRALLPPATRRRPIGAPDPLPPRVAKALAEDFYEKLTAAVAASDA